MSSIPGQLRRPRAPRPPGSVSVLPLLLSFGACALRGDSVDSTWRHVAEHPQEIGLSLQVDTVDPHASGREVVVDVRTTVAAEVDVWQEYERIDRYPRHWRGVLAPCRPEEQTLFADPWRAGYEALPVGFGEEMAGVERRSTERRRQATTLDHAMMVRWSVDELVRAGIGPNDGIATLTRGGFLQIRLDETMTQQIARLPGSGVNITAQVEGLTGPDLRFPLSKVPFAVASTAPGGGE